MSGLSGRVIGVTADRRGEDQAVMWERLGATVIHAPTMSTRKVPDPDLLRRRSEELIESPPDYLVADTGIGIRTWMDRLDGWGLADRLRAALTQTRIASRGPKASGALASCGLAAWWRCPSEQLADVVDHLLAEGLDGRRVALQLHGDDGAEWVAKLEAGGASVSTVPVYAWGGPPDPERVSALVSEVGAGRVDALTFTAAPQVRGLMAVARADGSEAAIRSAAVVIGCIGPVCAAAAEEAGLGPAVMPAAWRLGSLVKAVAERLGG